MKDSGTDRIWPPAESFFSEGRRARGRELGNVRFKSSIAKEMWEMGPVSSVLFKSANILAGTLSQLKQFFRKMRCKLKPHESMAPGFSISRRVNGFLH